MFGMLGSNRMPGLTAIFLLFTILTSATGFVIPPLLTEKLLPSHLFGILSLDPARDRLHRAIRHEARRSVALDLCA